jgi:hypothetical protein
MSTKELRAALAAKYGKGNFKIDRNYNILLKGKVKNSNVNFWYILPTI